MGKRPPLAILLSLLVLAGWWVACWVGTGAYFDALSDQAYRAESRRADDYAARLAAAFGRIIARHANTPQMLAGEPAVRRALARFVPGESDAEPAPPGSRRHWTAEPILAQASRRLADSARELGLDEAWLLDAAGDCIAASNAGGNQSLAATGHAGTDYFQAARQGKAGHQVAIGGKEHTPGLLFYAPILEHERFIGVVAGNLDIRNMAPWLAPANAILTDRSGAIVLAGDRDLLSALKSSPGDKRKQAWNPERFPDLVVMAGRSAPLILRSHLVAAVEPIVTVLWPVAGIDEYRRQRTILTAILGAAGTLLVLMGKGIPHHRWSRWPDKPSP